MVVAHFNVSFEGKLTLFLIELSALITDRQGIDWKSLPLQRAFYICDCSPELHLSAVARQAQVADAGATPVRLIRAAQDAFMSLYN